MDRNAFRANWVAKHHMGSNEVVLTMTKEIIDRQTGLPFDGQIGIIEGLIRFTFIGGEKGDRWQYIFSPDPLYGSHWLNVALDCLTERFGPEGVPNMPEEQK